MKRRNRAVPNLKRTKSGSSVYYYYKMPNGEFQALGKITPTQKTITDKEAVEATLALNASLRSPDSVLNRVLSITQQPERPQYDPRNPPMMQVIDEYRENQLKDEHARGRLSDQTLEAKLLVLREYDELLGKIQCQAVTTFDLAQHLKQRSGHVQQKHLPLLKKLFKYAISLGYRDTNPANELDAKEPEKRLRQRHSWDGYQQVRAAAPAWLQRAMDIALYSLQRRSDLLRMHVDHVDQDQRTISILQQKTRNYSKPVYIQINAGDSLWEAIRSSIASDVPCPFLIHCRPERMNPTTRKAKPHPFAVLPDYLSKHFSKWRDSSGAYNHLPKNQRPTFHDIRALGILMYHKAGYPMEYIMALAGHAFSATTEHYIEGHEQPKPVAVAAGLSLTEVAIEEIDWKTLKLPPQLAKLVEENEK